jgi:hypothetical protein
LGKQTKRSTQGAHTDISVFNCRIYLLSTKIAYVALHQKNDQGINTICVGEIGHMFGRYVWLSASREIQERYQYMWEEHHGAHVWEACVAA